MCDGIIQICISAGWDLHVLCMIPTSRLWREGGDEYALYINTRAGVHFVPLFITCSYDFDKCVRGGWVRCIDTAA